jgi:hypothetical protein
VTAPLWVTVGGAIGIGVLFAVWVYLETRKSSTMFGEAAMRWLVIVSVVVTLFCLLAFIITPD